METLCTFLAAYLPNYLFAILHKYMQCTETYPQEQQNSLQCGTVIARSLFCKIPPKRHPIARPLASGMGCLLWIQILIYILLESLERCMLYHVILDRVVTVLHCSCTKRSNIMKYIQIKRGKLFQMGGHHKCGAGTFLLTRDNQRRAWKCGEKSCTSQSVIWI